MSEGVNFEEFCYNHGINIKQVDVMSTKVRGFCYYNNDEYYVILNNKHSTAQLRKTTVHEIIHVLKNHFACSVMDVWNCEREVDAMISVMELVFI